MSGSVLSAAETAVTKSEDLPARGTSAGGREDKHETAVKLGEGKRPSGAVLWEPAWPPAQGGFLKKEPYGQVADRCEPMGGKVVSGRTEQGDGPEAGENSA